MMISTLTSILLLLLADLPCCCFSWSMKSTNFNSNKSNYPLSTRQALIQKAKSLTSSGTGTGTGSYSTLGWSNRAGMALTPAAIPGVYTADRPFLWNDIDVGCRMTVIELERDGGLWVHSPVALDGPLREALQKLNAPVKYVVSPNYEHVKFAKQWATAFPEASMWGCPGLMERLPDIDWAGEIPHSCRPPAWPDTNASSNSRTNLPPTCWDWNEIQPLHVDTEVNPFTGTPFFNEVIYYHTPSKTLLTTDLYWNYPKGDGVTNSNYEGLPGKDEEDFGVWELAPQVERVPLGSRLWKQGMDKVFRPFYLNLMVSREKRTPFREICEFLSSAWEIETVIPAHGDIIRGKTLIRTVFQDFFDVKEKA
jgi:hypothetical protein